MPPQELIGFPMVHVILGREAGWVERFEQLGAVGRTVQAE